MNIPKERLVVQSKHTRRYAWLDDEALRFTHDVDKARSFVSEARADQFKATINKEGYACEVVSASEGEKLAGKCQIKW